MTKEDFKRRIKKYAISVARFCKSLEYDPVIRSYIDQLVRSSATTAANYYAACRAKSKADFINKMKISEEEMDESVFFLEMIQEFYPKRKDETEQLRAEGNQLLAMLVSSINTTIKNLPNKSKI